MDKEDLIKELEEKEELIADLNNKLEEQKFIQSRDKEYIFTLENQLNKKNNKIKSLKKKNDKYKFKPVDNKNKSVKSKIFDSFLNRSNSYVFYKNNYELLRNAHKYDEKLLKENNSELKIYIKENGFLKTDIKNKQKDINYLKKVIKNKQKDIKYLEKVVDDKDSKIQDLNRHANAIENRIDYLINNSVNDIKDLNIAYVLNSFPKLSETFIVNEIRWLKENGYNVIVFKKHDPIKEVNIDFYVKTIRFNNELELEELLVENEINFMHTHFVYPICTNYTCPIAEKLKIPFTVFTHAYDIFVRESDEKNKIKEISESGYCKAIFTLSEFHKNYLLERGVDKDKIIITKQATGYELTPIIEKSDKIKDIISISRFVEKKGLDVLIDASKLLENEDYEFSLYGFGDLQDDLENQINELNCKNISIKGELHPDNVLNKIRESDLLIAPCKVAKNGDMDGFPTAIFEAMAVGTPVITTEVSAIPEIIEDGVNGFIIEPDNPQLLAEKIKEVSDMSNEDLFEIRKKAQEDVKDISSVDKTMEKFLDILRVIFK